MGISPLSAKLAVKMNAIAVLFSVFALANAMTTLPHHGHHNHGGHTHEPDEKDSIQFAYDHTNHQMAAMLGHQCYLYTVTPQEQIDVHTHTGLLSLEFQIMHMIENLAAQTTMPMTTVLPTTIIMRAVHHNIHSGHLCHDAKHVVNLN